VGALCRFQDNPSAALAFGSTKQLVISTLTPIVKTALGGPVVWEAVGVLAGAAVVAAGIGLAAYIIIHLLECKHYTTCGQCTNGVKPCFWCPASGTCHPVGSQQLHLDMSNPKCTKANCLSQWPSSTCRSAYCPDGSSVGKDDGPCGARLNCEACTKGKCFWCGISGSCHQTGSRYFDRRCTKSNCQSKSWLSSCHTSSCKKATKYEPKSINRPWKKMQYGKTAGAVRCGLDPNTIECASDDGAHCQWGSYSGKTWGTLTGVQAAKPLQVECPGWKPHGGGYACDKLKCYNGEQSPKEYTCGDPQKEAFTAYWDAGDCGHFGDDYNNELCGGINSGECPETWEGKDGDIIRFSDEVETKYPGLSEQVSCLKAQLTPMMKSPVFTKDHEYPFDNHVGDKGFTLPQCDKNCHYWWHAQYECVQYKE